MFKKFSAVALVIVLGFFTAKADEGMWLPLLLSDNEAEMKELGLQLTAEDIYSINNSSLKDAVVSLGGFCTAEIISDQGLVLTNHHCAFGQIQSHSTVTNDYLTDGFWAMDKSEELPNEGLSVSFLVRMEDMTTRINAALDTASEQERNGVIRKLSTEIVAEATADTHYNARLKSFFGGNDFYLMVYETFTDVRLVGAPPSSIGKYGGDTDNWMWPRHTGDFALLRVYTAPDGTPAEYSEENIPLKPKHHFPVSLDGVQEGDYAMIMGFPGSTDRYLTSYGIQEAIDQKNPTIVDIRDKKLSIMREHMDASDKVRIQYASKYASTANYWKYFIGQTKGLKRMKVYDKKKSVEDSFTNWVNEDEARVEKYGEALNLIADAYYDNHKYNVNRIFLNEAVFQGADVFYFTYQVQNAIKNLPEDVKERRLAINELKDLARSHFKDYNKDLDQDLFAGLLELYSNTVPKSQQSPGFEKVKTHWYTKGDWNKFAAYVYKTSPLVDRAKFFDFLENPTEEKLNKDYAVKMFNDIFEYYIQNISPKRSAIRADLAQGERLFSAGLREMMPNKKFYPNANSTMRLTYGTVEDYTPGDAMHYDYVTTIDGLMAKEDPADPEFIVPARLSELFEQRNFGRYADENGDLIINFISSNDITGGNSGSPVLNAYGDLIGTAFDGNWEAMSGDIAFENEVQRTISVDIRYTLFVIDKFAGARHLVDEMTIAPKRPNKMTEEEKAATELAAAIENPLTIVTELETINYLGEDIPVLDMHSFGSAFDTAVAQFGSSADTKFYWRGTVYTTEKR
ncbi:MAG: serine protease [Flavobacteriales bacterium]|nr:serine protease [Flavobacteriales bacterium]|tara:strand:+ start:3825 stop:6212 length:2388 start_codon:yes stop_codon:yes gene_type:complete